MLRYPARFKPAEEGGDTFEEALVMAEDALDGYLTVLYQDGRDIPPPSNAKDDGVVFVDVRLEAALPIGVESACRH